MAEPFKNWICAETIRWLGDDLARGVAGFDVDAFVADSMRGLEPLELKARVRKVGFALRRHLAADWPEALSQMVAALPPEEPNHEGVTAHLHWWPVLDLVEQQRLLHVEPSVIALSRLTTRFSAEFAIRPYLATAPGTVWPLLENWVEHPDLHVRRWLSEGTRSRLPWGMRLAGCAADPTRGLAVIDALVDDPSSYVRRSVANHLGDVAKDHPDRAVVLAKRWMDRAERRPLVQHALRDLLKRGHAGALALFGAPGKLTRIEAVRLAPGLAVRGGVVELYADLQAATSGSIRIDVVWAWPGAKTGWCQKVFRGETRDVLAGDAWAFRYRQSLRPASGRPIRAGEHRLTLRVNGEDVASAKFVVVGSEVDATAPGV